MKKSTLAALLMSASFMVGCNQMSSSEPTGQQTTKPDEPVSAQVEASYRYNIRQVQPSGAVYTGLVRISVHNGEILGQVFWDNHVWGIVKGQRNYPKINFQVTYPDKPGVVGNYEGTASIGGISWSGTCVSNAGDKATWSMVIQ